jgi:glutathione peroxidase
MKMLWANLWQPQWMLFGMMIFSLLRPDSLQAKNPGGFYDFTLTGIEGQALPLKDYAGRVVLVVNTASQCGFTPQYAGLQKLYAEFKDQGLVVLGIPANDFMGQEPADNAAIKKFCDINFKIDFPLAEKSVVTGNNAIPLYQWLASAPNGAKPKWNFHKFLIGRDGKLIDNWSSFTKPESEKLRAAIIQALAAKPGG